jgi:tetratricopeptide (TPR) repeat protein
MSPFATILASVVVSAAVSFAVVELRGSPSHPPAGEASALQSEIAALQSEVAALRGEVAAQRGRSAAAPMRASQEASARTAVPDDDVQVAAAVDRYLAALGDELPAKIAALRAAAVDPAATFAELRDDAGFWESDDNAKRYEKIFAADRMDDLIAQFEAAAKASPGDAQAQMDLANAYLAYVQLDDTKYEYSLKADAVLDQVLELDDHHWEARFTKAVSYTFWPEFLGKKPEAIAHLERLVTQQDGMPVEDYHAETYLILGNLLEQRDPARAREVWERGMRRHPENADLQKKLGR